MLIICEHCQTPFSVSPSVAKRPRRFCSQQCAKLVMVGSRASNFKGGKTETACGSCGRMVVDWPSQKKGEVFCSKQCHGESLRFKIPHNKGKLQIATKPCAQCGGVISGQPALVRRRRFCSHLCAALAARGSNDKRLLGISRAEYNKWRLTIIFRDGGRCRWCDSEKHRTYSNLEVHHIIPVRAFQEGTLNDDNAITLCRDHHNITRGRENEYAAMLSGLLGKQLIAPPAPNRKDRVPFTGTQAELSKLYIDQRQGLSVIGEYFGVTGACISKYIKKWNIKREAA